MNNKLGLSDFKIIDVEKKIVNLKLNLIDEYFTFNERKLNFNYLEKINKFLFSDIYESIEVKEDVKNIINNYLGIITDMLMEDKENITSVLDIIKNIWFLQPFVGGNTRTLIAYLIILNKAFDLGLHIDLNKEIESGVNTFDLNNFVNQKRLTKQK